MGEQIRNIHNVWGKNQKKQKKPTYLSKRKKYLTYRSETWARNTGVLTAFEKEEGRERTWQGWPCRTAEQPGRAVGSVKEMAIRAQLQSCTDTASVGHPEQLSSGWPAPLIPDISTLT